MAYNEFWVHKAGLSFSGTRLTSAWESWILACSQCFQADDESKEFKWMNESREKLDIGVQQELNSHTRKEEKRSSRMRSIQNESQNFMSISASMVNLCITHYKPVPIHKLPWCKTCLWKARILNQKLAVLLWSLRVNSRSCSHGQRQSEIHLMRAAPAANSNWMTVTNQCHMLHHIICLFSLPKSINVERF